MAEQVPSRRAWLFLGAGLAIFLAIGFVWVGGSRVFSMTGTGLFATKAYAQVNREAPDFELASLSEENIRLSSLQGKPVILNFWATWCAPCVEEMPSIQRFYEKHPGEFSVVAVNADEPEFDVRQFVDDMGLTFSVVLDPGGVVQELYHLRGYPTTFFLDSSGTIRFEHIGQLHGDQLAEYMRQLGVGE